MPYLGLIVMVLWVFCLVDVIVADEHAVRNIRRSVGPSSSCWCRCWARCCGWSRAVRKADTAHRVVPDRRRRSPSTDRPGRHIAQDSETDEEFLRRCRERAEEQRRIGREQRRAQPD